MIRKIKGQYCLYSKDGTKKLGCHSTLAEARAQEKAIKMKKKQTSIELAVIPMPICPVEPFTALNGQKVTKEAIQDLLNYDPNYRMAYLYMNPKSAHNHDGETNKAVLGRFPKKHYVKDGIIYGDVELQKLYVDPKLQKQFEHEILLTVSDIGGYPSRSLDLIPTTFQGKTKYLFDGVAAVGAAKGAIPNLPTIKFDELAKLNGIQSFSISFSKGEEKKDMTKEEVEKMLKEQREDMEKQAKETLQLALDSQKKELTTSFNEKEKAIKDQISITEKTLAKKEANLFFSQDNVKKKIFSTQRDNAASILLALEQLPDAKIELSVIDKDKKQVTETMSLADSFKNFVENLPDYVRMSGTTSGSETSIEDIPDREGEKVLLDPATKKLHLVGKDSDEQRTNLIRAAAAELKLSLADRKTYAENFEKAEKHAISLSLDSSNAKHLFTRDSETNLSKEN